MKTYICKLRKGVFNGKNGRFLGGAIVQVSSYGAVSGNDIEKAMIAQFGPDAKGCGYRLWWEVTEL